MDRQPPVFTVSHGTKSRAAAINLMFEFSPETATQLKLLADSDLEHEYIEIANEVTQSIYCQRISPEIAARS